jgi:hypothetical protein
MLQGQRAINGKDAACFWWTLYIFVRPVHTAMLKVADMLYSLDAASEA